MKKRVILIVCLCGLMVGCIMPKASSEDNSEPIVIIEETPEETSEVVLSDAYELTSNELATIQSVVMAEAGAEPYEGQMAIAQCILNACIKDDIRPTEAIKKYKYTSHRPEPTLSVKAAVSAVFSRGEKVLSDDTIYFYAPDRCVSSWHESQQYVATIGGHRFFEEVN